MTAAWTRRAGLALATLLLALAGVRAGSPLVVWQDGRPYLWADGGRGITFHPDQGGLGPLDQEQAQAFVSEAFQRWQDIETASATYVQGESLPVDVDATNFVPYAVPLFPDGLSAIVFDEDGSLFDLLVGPGSGVLGFAGPEWVNLDDGTIVEGVAFLNGRFIDSLFPAEEYFGVLVHEFGHFNNLSHTAVNGQIALVGDATGPSPHDTFPPENLFQRIETMYPFKFVGAGEDTPHADDIAIFSTMYPAPGFFESSGSIRGAVLAPDGVTRLSGVNVIARNVDDPFDDAVSAVSGDFSESVARDDPLTGTYTLNGLTPGATYAVFVDQLVAGSFTVPVLFPLPGVEEFYNGPDESADEERDDPAVFSGLSPGAGERLEGIDIVFNRRRPGAPLPVGDDGSVELFLPFPFEFCGRTYGSVFANANGSLTFGRPSAEFRERIANLLAGPPRIAGFWDDLDASDQGLVTWDVERNAVSFTWDDVPEFDSEEGNTFRIVLERASNRIRLEWDEIAALDGTAGFSCGITATTGQEEGVDLSRLARRGAASTGTATALFERWTQVGNPSDISFMDLELTATDELRDRYEPNDSLRRPARVSLPFESSRPVGGSSQLRFTTLELDGSDVDYFAFPARAGTTLFAEVVESRMDSLIGLFDPEGRLIALDDDDGTGLLSRLAQPLVASGTYTLAVSTFPDLAFDGGGGPGARYGLRLRAEQGLQLALGDDDTVLVPLPFPFPYQGRTWSAVYINSNGSLTFGAGDLDFSESVEDFLAGPPRIAGLWYDLSPDAGGEMILESAPDRFTVRFVNVPEFFTGAVNTFAITLEPDGGVRLAYGELSGNGGLVGVTAGDGAADPGPTDLSAAPDLSSTGTTYEMFGPGEVDLPGRTLVFRSP